MIKEKIQKISKTIISKFVLFLIPVLVIIPAVGMAQTEQNATNIICNTFQIGKNIVLAFGFGMAVIMIIVSGIRYMTAASDQEKVGKARKGLINAFIGILIVIAAGFIISLAQGVVADTGSVNLLSSPCPQLLTQ